MARRGDPDHMNKIQGVASAWRKGDRQEKRKFELERNRTRAEVKRQGQDKGGEFSVSTWRCQSQSIDVNPSTVEVRLYVTSSAACPIGLKDCNKENDRCCE